MTNKPAVKVEIVGVYLVTEDNGELFDKAWDCDPQDSKLTEILAQIREQDSAKMERADHPDVPYIPNKTDEPKTEQWLWVDPAEPTNTDIAIGLFVDNEDGSGKRPRKWLLGNEAEAIIIYKKSCCPQYSAILCAQFDDGLKVRIRDDALTEGNCLQLFNGFIAVDSDGRELSHDLRHIVSKDTGCDHGSHNRRTFGAKINLDA